jgi:hypothetical protein
LELPFVGQHEGLVFMPPPPTNIPETERRNIKAVTLFTRDEQAKVSVEME